VWSARNSISRRRPGTGCRLRNKEGKVVCFFRDAAKFKERYAMFGFNDSAKLDDGSMWPVAFALTKLTKADEARIAKLVKQAVS
jgi:uncharacterized protein YdhG (YjbR/CyaY superfamily)